MESEDLRKAGLKVTHPRTRILELLETTGVRHMSAEDIYRRLINSGEEIGLATVYRVLTQFEGAGLVLKHNFEGGQAVYELDHGQHHDHMVDVESGKVIEFTRSIYRADAYEFVAELKLGDADDDTLLAAMAVHPILLNRPIVVTPNGAKLCRPGEMVEQLL